MTRVLPQDPLIRRLAVQAKNATLTRRKLLHGVGVGAASLGVAALTACSDQPVSHGNVRWASWTYYLDFDQSTGRYPTLEAFQERTDISVEYFEDIDNNKTFLAKINDQLRLGQDIGYDLFCLSDSSVIRVLEDEQLTAFDRNLLPNVNAQMIPLVQTASFDLDRKWSIPYQAGMTGLVYNTLQYPKGVRHVSDLWDSVLAGKVNLLNSYGDTLSLIMLDQGVNISDDTWGDDELFAALEIAERHIMSGQVSSIKGNSYTQDLQNETVWAGMAWSGDVAMLNEEAGETIWQFVVPERGASLFVDSFCMPTRVASYDQVHTLIDYYYEPEVAAEVAAYVQYVCPVAEAQQAMQHINPELADNELIFPGEALSSKIVNMRALTAAEDKQYTQAYQQVLGT